MLATPDDLLLTLATIARARRSDLEPSPADRGARLVLGPQIVRHTQQATMTRRRDFWETVRFSPAFCDLHDDVEATVDHLLATGVLAEREGIVTLTAEGHRRYAGRQLLAVFESAPTVDVVTTDGVTVGTVDRSLTADPRLMKDGLVLGGRSWMVTRIDERHQQVVVASGGSGRPLGWRGQAAGIDRATWSAVREVLGGMAVPAGLDELSERWLAEEQREWVHRLAEPVRITDATVTAATFAGDAAHQSVLRMLGLPGMLDGPLLTVEAAPQVVRDAVLRIEADVERSLDEEAVTLAAAMSVPHRELCATSALEHEARAHVVDAVGVAQVLARLRSALVDATAVPRKAPGSARSAEPDPHHMLQPRAGGTSSCAQSSKTKTAQSTTEPSTAASSTSA